MPNKVFHKNKSSKSFIVEKVLSNPNLIRLYVIPDTLCSPSLLALVLLLNTPFVLFNFKGCGDLASQCTETLSYIPFIFSFSQSSDSSVVEAVCVQSLHLNTWVHKFTQYQRWQISCDSGLLAHQLMPSSTPSWLHSQGQQEAHWAPSWWPCHYSVSLGTIFSLFTMQ